MANTSIIVDIQSNLNGRTLYWLAKESNLPYWTIHKIANNKTKGISFDVLGKICDVLECTPNDLLVKVEVKRKILDTSNKKNDDIG